MDKLKRRYLVYQLMPTLDWMGRSDDWFKRSELVTRTMGIIRNLCMDTNTFFGMDEKYLISDYDKARVYRAKLNDCIDKEDQKAREDAIFDFYVWLHEIKVLQDDE